MKKEYEGIELEVIQFETEDVIRCSCTDPAMGSGDSDDPGEDL